MKLPAVWRPARATLRLLGFAVLSGLLGLLISAPMTEGGFTIRDWDVAWPFLFFFAVGLVLAVLKRPKRG